jgi:adenosylcobinamide-GDP ribazoletransferase
VVSILARAALLAELGRQAVWALPLAFSGARVGPIWLMSALPFVTPPDVAKSGDIVRGTWVQALVAWAWFALAGATALAWGWITTARLLAAVAALAVVTVITGLQYRRRVGGITGDFLGATEQLGEIAVLAVLAYGA